MNEPKLLSLGTWLDVWPELTIVAHGRLRRLWLAGPRDDAKGCLGWFVDPHEVVELQQRDVVMVAYGGAPTTITPYTDVRVRSDGGARLVLGNVATVAALLELEQHNSPPATRADIDRAVREILDVMLAPLGATT